MYSSRNSFGVRQRGRPTGVSLPHSVEVARGKAISPPARRQISTWKALAAYLYRKRVLLGAMGLLLATGGGVLRLLSSIRRHAPTSILGFVPVQYATAILILPAHTSSEPIEWPWVDDLDIDPEPDFGDLDIGFLVSDEDKRIVYREAGLDQGDPVSMHSKTYWYYAFDDDISHNPQLWWNQEVEQNDDDRVKEPRTCRRVAWFRDIHPDCNTIHETDAAGSMLDDKLTLIGDGSFRIVFRADPAADVPYVFKTYQWNSAGGGEETFSKEDVEYMRMDALVSEKFSADPWFVDMYGFCGVTMLSEIMLYKDLERYALPKFNRKKKTIDAYEPEEQLHLNRLAPDEKLEIALQMAKALTHLHNYKGGRLVHGDLWIAQFLPMTNWTEGVPLGGEQILKFNDFNRAEAMLWDEDRQEYCKYERGQGGGDWRSPEEFASNPLDEKVDIFAMGINIFTLVTGYYIFPELSTSREVRQKLRDGHVPEFDDRIWKRSFAERKLGEVAKLCMAFNPKKRISADELLQFLREAKAENEELKQKKKKGLFK